VAAVGKEGAVVSRESCCSSGLAGEGRAASRPHVRFAFARAAFVRCRGISLEFHHWMGFPGEEALFWLCTHRSSISAPLRGHPGIERQEKMEASPQRAAPGSEPGCARPFGSSSAGELPSRPAALLLVAGRSSPPSSRSSVPSALGCSCSRGFSSFHPFCFYFLTIGR